MHFPYIRLWRIDAMKTLTKNIFSCRIIAESVNTLLLFVKKHFNYRVYIWRGCNGVLNRVDVPVLNAPTNILALLIIYSGCLAQFQFQPVQQLEKPICNAFPG